MTEYCRLCAELKDPDEIVASLNDVGQLMEQKLRACCCWTTENTEQHRLPHSVCAICLVKLDECWLFSQSVQLAQQRLLEIFDEHTFYTPEIISSIKIENEHETEMESQADVEIETKPLAVAAVEIEQTDYDCPDYSDRNSPSPRQSPASAQPSTSRKQKKNSQKVNPLESNGNQIKTNALHGTRHKCTICDRYFSKGWNLQQHLRQRHSDDRPYQCRLCPKAFKTKNALTKHSKHQPENKCEHCSRHFCLIMELNEHESACERPNVGSIKVESNEPAATHFNHRQIGIASSSSAQMEDRIDQPIAMSVGQIQITTEPLSMRKMSLGKIECNICGRAFARRLLMIQHRKTHSSERLFECWLCHKTFQTRNKLKIHIEIHTTFSQNRMSIIQAKKRAKLFELYGDIETIDFKRAEHKCHLCLKIYSCKSTLQEHHIRIHSNKRPFECTLCHRTVKVMKGLKEHMKRVHVKKPSKQNWVCELCGKAFTKKQSLSAHKKCAHSDQRPFKCDTCGMSFKLKTILKSHQKTHTHIQYDCDQCEKTFRTKHHLRRHIEFHTGSIAKPFACDDCGKGFRIAFNLMEHRRIHSGEKPHNCEHCGSNFRTLSSCYSHLKKAHGISKSALNREELGRAAAMPSSSTADPSAV